MQHQEKNNQRLRIIAIFFIVVTIGIIGKLFVLQIIQVEYYRTFALSSHEIYQQLHPKRGEIFFQDTRNKQEFPAAINRQYFLVYAVPSEIKLENVSSTVDKLIQILSLPETDREILNIKLAKPNDPYEPVVKKIDSDTIEKLKLEKLDGIYSTPQEYRYYPEENTAASILGFCRLNDEGTQQIGNYGVEGYWDKILTGRQGFISGERGALGSWITMAMHSQVNAQDGADLLLTIDRSLEYKACELLQKGLEEYQAKSASLVMMNPKTGAILAMCSLPDFDPNKYSEVKDLRAFSNNTIFAPYEPGSVFKPVTMAAGVDLGLVSPNTTFNDPCVRVINGYSIRNAMSKCYGTQTMTQVLENSINTGMIFVEEKLGHTRLGDYVKKFGFGEKTGIELGPEATGDVSSLERKGEVFGAVGSFGQGLTVTPIQLAAAYSAIANKGLLPKPFIVAETRYPNGQKEVTPTEKSVRVISERTAKLMSGMLTSVVENHYKIAKVDGYYVAGKTGTAQIAETGGYSDERTNHTFAGFAPATNPQFVLVVKYEEPQRQWAEQTSLFVFRDLMKFALQYYVVPTDR
ncbi:MAG: penicillin-binding protein 2 [Candidatus Magasanikbacteria bacterium]